MARKDGLPDYVNPAKLVKDPHGRQGHWLYPPTDEVFSLGHNWQPPNTGNALTEKTGGRRWTRAELSAMTKPQMFEAAATSGLTDFDGMTKVQLTDAILALQEASPEELPDDPDGKLGKRVQVTWGRFEGRKGQVSDVNEQGAVSSVILDGDGQTLPIDDEVEQVRFLTAEEVAADEAALKAEKAAQTAAGQAQTPLAPPVA